MYLKYDMLQHDITVAVRNDVIKRHLYYLKQYSLLNNEDATVSK